MAIDFEKLRKRFDEISGNKKRSNDFWKPDVGTHYVRILPMNIESGIPFVERRFYYNIGGSRPILAPYQFNKPDPIQELIKKVRDENYDLAKLLFDKSRIYAGVIVRGEEEKGPQLWSFGKKVYEQLLSIMIDPDYGDITDPLEGRDIKVTVSKTQGFQFPMVSSVDARPKVTPLSTDSDLASGWLENIPNVDEIYSLMSYEEIEKVVNDWLDAGATTDGFEKKFSSDKSEDDDSSDSSSSSNPDFEKAFEDLMKK